MKKLMKKLLLLAMVATLAVGTMFSMTACGEKDKGKENKLIVATEALFDPFEYVDPKTNDYTGFDIELITMLAKKMGYDGIEVKDMPFDSVLGAVSTGNADCAIAAMTINPKRAKAVDFATPYYEDSAQWILVKSDDTIFTGTTKEELDAQLVGKTIGVAKGQTGAYYVQGGGDFDFTGVQDAKMKEYSDIPSAVAALKGGIVQCVLADNAVAEELTSKNPDIKAIKVALTVEAYGIAVKKGNAELVNKINTALETVKKDGSFDTLYNKYFG